MFYPFHVNNKTANYPNLGKMAAQPPGFVALL
jgi:hypothetical protein